jgi:hypothetical protein
MSLARHDLLATLASLAMEQLTDEEIMKMCPSDYGDELSEDHMNYVWDKLYTDYDRMDDAELYDFWEQVQEAIGRETMARWMDGESDEEPTINSSPSRTLH